MAKSGTRLRERLLRDVANQLTLLMQMHEEFVDLGLGALAHAAEYQREHGM